MQKKDELRQFGSSLHAMRKRKHMTQMQLADALDEAATRDKGTPHFLTDIAGINR